MDLTAFEQDTTVNCVLDGEVPIRCKEEPCCLGIDEAGRGPVLGPMVYGVCYSPISLKDEIIKMGLADSKTLTEDQREAIFKKIDDAKDAIGWIVDILSPNYISTSMLRRCKYNLNELSHDTAIGLIEKVLAKEVNLKEVFVDTVGDPAKYQAKLQKIFPDLEITVAKKADSTYPIVGAASICAKVARDRSVKDWKFMEAIDVENYGSGYPGDPLTKKFMADNIDAVFGYPQFVRFSWSTAANLLEDKAVRVHWEDDDEDATPVNQPAISAFFQSNSRPPVHKKHAYFQDRSLSQMSTL
ncbi:Ribonuclease H2 subunit A [Lamellibrachia satsuma]|nr:Ribonuclease H2 subunit A [Lamellibrachia satsuma]